MKRDMDLIRKILLAVEELPYGDDLQRLDGVSKEAFVMHALWLKEAGLVDAAAEAGSGSFAKYAIIWRLTWSGTEFVSAMRDEALWNKVKKKFMGWSASLTADMVKAALVAEAVQRLASGG